MPIHVEEHAAFFHCAAVLLLQLECPLPSVLHDVRIRESRPLPDALQRLVSQSDAALLVTGPDRHRILAASDAVRSVCGFSAAELLGRDIPATLQSGTPLPDIERMRAALNAGEFHGPTTNLHHDGHHYHQYLSILPAAEGCFVGLLTPTERRLTGAPPEHVRHLADLRRALAAPTSNDGADAKHGKVSPA